MVYHFIELTERVIRRLDRCQLIVRCGVGYDNVDIQAARRFGIPVANVPDYGTEEVADSAMGLMLSLTRGIHRANSVLRARPGEWTYDVSAPLVRLRGRVLGIVGLGRIGSPSIVVVHDVKDDGPVRPSPRPRTPGRCSR